MTDVRGVSDLEAGAWRAYVEVTGELAVRLERDLHTGHGLSLGDFQVLVQLSDAPAHRSRMSDLARQLRLSPSGLTRRLDGLVKSGLVAREPSSEDRRVALAVLTGAGLAALTAAAPDHRSSVRRHLLDHLSRKQVEHLADVLAAVRAGWDAAGATATD